jgi:hypothetical protein
VHDNCIGQVLYGLVFAFATLYALVLLLDYGYFASLAHGLVYMLLQYTPIKLLL